MKNTRQIQPKTDARLDKPGKPSATSQIRLVILVSVALASATGHAERMDPLSDSTLKPCPSSPNCVSSDASDSSHHIEGFILVESSEESWRAVTRVIETQPRTKVTLINATQLSAEVSSRVFGFVDDLDLEFRAGTGSVAVRSASRTGYWDLGANRSRVENLRTALRSRGLIR